MRKACQHANIIKVSIERKKKKRNILRNPILAQVNKNLIAALVIIAFGLEKVANVSKLVPFGVTDGVHFADDVLASFFVFYSLSADFFLKTRVLAFELLDL